MTNEQRKVLKYVNDVHSLPKILNKFNYENYDVFQDFVGYKNLEFSDCNFDEKTIVELTDIAKEEIETFDRKIFDVWFTRTLSIIALAISVGALIVSIISLNEKADNRYNNSENRDSDKRIIESVVSDNLNNFF